MNIIVLLAMLLCLFAPTVIFTLVGLKAMNTVGKRPSDSGRAMIGLLIKLIGTTIVLLGILMGLLKAYAVEPEYFTPAKLAFVSDAELAQMIKKAEEEKKSDFLIVDLRIEADYAKGQIPQSMNVPFPKLRFTPASVLLPDKTLILSAYSAQEKSAENAFIFLYNKGYRNLKILQGGWDSWRKNQLLKKEN